MSPEPRVSPISVRRDARMTPSPAQPGDLRAAAERDVDRLIHSAALRRLADITQVEAGGSVHNRLTHSLEVTQVGRRMAQRLQRQNPTLAGELDPEVVAAAGLAHDLGHPPFGHVGEEELNALSLSHGGRGFEGNAQSLRIVSRLAVRSRAEGHGLNLTRASLRAVMKYPWTPAEVRAGQKYGVYSEDRSVLEFVMAGESAPYRPSLEAQVMDHADDITYAVHDLSDYAQAGRLPLHILGEPGGVEAFIASERAAGRDHWTVTGADAQGDQHAQAQLVDAARELVEEVLRPIALNPGGARAPWEVAERCARLTSQLSLRAWTDPERPGELLIDTRTRLQLAFLKAVIWQFVIDGPQTGVHQHGARRTIAGLFGTFHRAARTGTERRIFPAHLMPAFDECAGRRGSVYEAKQARLACDAVSGLGERQASGLWRELSGWGRRD